MRSERRSGIGRHVTYANVMSTLAVFLVLVAGGTAVAATAHKNSVNSNAVKDNTLLSRDLKDGKAVGSKDVIDNSLRGDDIDESTLVVPPSGPAGGGLTGTYPNPTIASNAVGSGNVVDNSLNEGDLAGSSVTSSELGTITRVQKATTIAANSFGTAIATCPAGSIALSGGGRGNLGLPVIALSKENVSEAWVYQAQNTTASPQTITAFVYCLAS